MKLDKVKYGIAKFFVHDASGIDKELVYNYYWELKDGVYYPTDLLPVDQRGRRSVESATETIKTIKECFPTEQFIYITVGDFGEYDDHYTRKTYVGLDYVGAHAATIFLCNCDNDNYNHSYIEIWMNGQYVETVWDLELDKIKF